MIREIAENDSDGLLSLYMQLQDIGIFPLSSFYMGQIISALTHGGSGI